jgi:hypothetical protein
MNLVPVSLSTRLEFERDIKETLTRSVPLSIAT